MSTAPSSTARRPPARLAVAGGVTTASSVGGLALMVAGHGIVAWVLMLAGGICAATIQLSRRVTDVAAPPPTPLGAVAGILALIGLLVAFALGARAVVVDHPWLAALLTLTAGAAAAVMLRWWQLRPVTRPA